MDAIQQEIHVSFQYPVHFTTGVFTAANPLLRDVVTRPGASGVSRVLVVLDSGVEATHPGLLDAIRAYFGAHSSSIELAASVVVLPGGEQVKNDFSHVERLLAAMHAAALCRHSYLVAVGGGAVLDAAGFAAATAHRGVRLIRVPTTVLAQDDSAVGVKNGINAFGKKNYIGTFAPPFAVINDFAFLATLTDRDWRSGVTEAVKAAIIRDPAFFDYLEANAVAIAGRDRAIMEQVIRRSAALHLAHIATCGDPFELGSSRPLDFGHWAAHKLEQLTDYRMRHGEAVGIGIALDTTYSYLAGLLPERQWRRIVGLIHALGLAVYAPALSESFETPQDPRSVLRGLAEFQEHLGGRLTIMLLQDIGRPLDVHEIRIDLMRESIATLETFDSVPAANAGQKAS